MIISKVRTIIWFLAGSLSAFSQPMDHYEVLTKDVTPLELACFVADKIVDHTRFQYEYVIQKPYADVEFVDFGKSLNRSKPAVAYALSTLYSEVKQVVPFEVGRTGDLKIWVNDSLVFQKNGDRDFEVLFDEKTYVLPECFTARLEKGENKILVKSAYGWGGDWKFFLQSRYMGPYAPKNQKITASLKEYAPSVSLVNWLILGCFENKNGRGINTAYEPEQEIHLHKLYDVSGSRFTWDIPRIHVITGNPGGGKFYNWSYHVGGFVWGLQRLSQETKLKKYQDYAASWCEHILNTMPLARYQTKELHAVRSMNWGAVERPMLDYTTAPSLPFLTRLLYEDEFPLREQYRKHAEKILDYVLHDQYRLSSGLFARRYTSSPSVWADDMFMGIPYLIFAADYTDDRLLREQLLDDAANQIVQFNKLLYKKDKQLYMQACFADRPEERIPFWSRGNGWAIWGTTEVLLHLPKSHKHYKSILRIYRDHVEGIVHARDDEGYWHNILDRHDTVRESSGAAMFVLAIARGINNGWLDRATYGKVVEQAWSSLKTFVDAEGNLHGVKGGTNFSPDPADYAKTPFIKSDTHGILPLLFACMEMQVCENGK